MKYIKTYEEYPSFKPVIDVVRDFESKNLIVPIDDVDEWMDLSDEEFKNKFVNLYKKNHMTENFHLNENVMDINQFKEKYKDLISNYSKWNVFKSSDFDTQQIKITFDRNKDIDKTIAIHFKYNKDSKLSFPKQTKIIQDNNNELINDIKSLNYNLSNIEKDRQNSTGTMIFVQKNPHFQEKSFGGLDSFLIIDLNDFKKLLPLQPKEFKDGIMKFYNNKNFMDVNRLDNRVGRMNSKKWVNE